MEGDILTIKVQGYDNIKEKDYNQAWSSDWSHSPGSDEWARDFGIHSRQETDLD